MPLSTRAGAGLVAVGAEVQLTADAALAFQLAKDHGGWAPPMADCLGRCGTVVDIVNSQGDVRVNCGDYGSYVWNPAAIVGPAAQRDSTGHFVFALDLHPRRLLATPAASAQGSCGVCRRSLETTGVSSTVSVASAAVGQEAAESTSLLSEPPVAFCSRDGAFKLCYECAAPYLDSSEAAFGVAGPASLARLGGPLDCPGRHGLSNVSASNMLEAARCDVCGKSPLSSSGNDVPRACRSCNWVACHECVKSSPCGVNAPQLDIGSCCRAEKRGKPTRAVVVDVREDFLRGAEVLLHYPGQGTETSDEWVEVASHRITPVSPPTTGSRFHPAHRGGLHVVRLPRGADLGPKCAAELKFAGGCRRYVALANNAPPPSPAVGLYCERDEFYLCPWCSGDDVIEHAATPAGAMVAHQADVAALRDPARCGDAAARVARQCFRSMSALAGLLQAGVVGATAEALVSLATACKKDDAPPTLQRSTSQLSGLGEKADSVSSFAIDVFDLFLDLAEWLFFDAVAPQVGDRALCEVAADTWQMATIVEISCDSSTTQSDGAQPQFIVEYSICAGSALQRTTLRQEQVKLPIGPLPINDPDFRKTAMARNLASQRQAATRQGVPPPALLTRDYLMKKAFPSDNTAQARQYLADGADLSTCSESGDGALVLALEHGCTPKMVELLLEFGCPFAAGATLGEPLALAARYGQVENVELLLDAGADPAALFSSSLPDRAAKRIASFAALSGLGLHSESAVATVSLCLASEREILARYALPSLARLVASPPEELVEAAAMGTEARLLKVLSALLGACSNGDGSLPCLEELSGLVQRLMSTYNATATRGALLLIRRLLVAGPEAREQLDRCGARRYVARLVSAADAHRDVEVKTMALEAIREMDASGASGLLYLSRQPPVAVQKLTEVAALASDSEPLTAHSKQEAVSALQGLVELLEGGGTTGFELEDACVPQALVTLVEHGALTMADLLQANAGAGTSGCLATALLRIVETAEALCVQPLPDHLSHAPGLRVLCEPVVLALLREDSAGKPLPGLQIDGLGGPHWLQIEPLLRIRDLERMILLMTPMLDWDFLVWCVTLVGQDVQPRNCVDENFGGGAASAGRILDFRLATPLRLPVHRLRRASDGREVDLIASVHGLAAVGVPDGHATTEHSADVRLRVALFRFEASTNPGDLTAGFDALRSAAAKGRAIISPRSAEGRQPNQPIGACGEEAVWVPCGSEEVLQALGFVADSGQPECWFRVGETSLEPLLDGILDGRNGNRHEVDESCEPSLPAVEPDPDMVMELSSLFTENGARRACIAVKNASVEAAIEWACVHQGDPDFNDALPEPPGRGGCAADPRAPVWSVFIVLPQGVPFDLVWPMLEDPVKGALTSVANAWTAMGWAGGEAEMRETLRAQVDVAGEGPIARGLLKAKADRVASRLKSACECRVQADPGGAQHAPSSGGGRASAGAGGPRSLAPGARIQLVLEAEQLGFVAAVSEDADGTVDVVTDDGRLLQNLPPDQVRSAPRLPPLPMAGAERPRTAPSTASGAQTGATDVGLAPTALAEPLIASPMVPLQCNFEAIDRGAQESDVVRRFQPCDLLASQREAQDGQSPEGKVSLQPAPSCRVAFSWAALDDAGAGRNTLCLLRGERACVHASGTRGMTSTSWLTVGAPRLAVASGSWYYEVELIKFKNPQVGWADSSFRFLVGAYSDDGVGDDDASWAADCERKCLWHEGAVGEWRSASAGQTLGCAITITGPHAQMRFAIDGVWDAQPVFSTMLEAHCCVFPAVSGELEVNFRFDAAEMAFEPPAPHFRPIGESPAIMLDSQPLASPSTATSAPLILPPGWTLLQGLFCLAGPEGLTDEPAPLAIRAEVHSRFGWTPLREQAITVTEADASLQAASPPDALLSAGGGAPLALRRADFERGLPLVLSDEERDEALQASGLTSPAARAALRLLRELRQGDLTGGPADATSVVDSPGSLATSVSGNLGPATESARASSSGPNNTSGSTVRRGNSRRLGAKLACHLEHPLACCAGAFPRWCRELPILAPWLFPIEEREALLRCNAFGVTFAVRWFQERAVDDRFAERRRNAEGRLAQAKLIGDAALLNSAYESYFELQGQIARDPEAWVGSLKSELARVEREGVLQQAIRAMELTRSSSCALEVQFEGESGFGRAVTQGFYTLVAHDVQRRSHNREAPLWVEDESSFNEEFLTPRRGLILRPLPQDDPRLPEVERRLCMLGRLMAKALREGFVVPLPLTAGFFQLLLGGDLDPVAMLPQPGDGIAGEFVGGCAKLVADAVAQGGQGKLESLAADPEWSRKYMQPPNEEPVPPVSFEAYAGPACFVETGLSGPPLCPGGEDRQIDARTVAEFVLLATNFWLVTGVERQMAAFRRGLYDVLGSGAVALWAFSPAELRRLFCGEDEVVWTDKELAEHLHCGGGYGQESEQVRWLREELLDMAQPYRSKFLEFVTSCPRLPPGGLKELQISVHPDPAGGAGLPRSRACAHRLFLPRYTSREELSRQLLEAILSAGGHHELQLPL